MGAILNWLSENYQWLFSGLGVFLIGLIVYKKRSSNKIQIKTKGDYSPGVVGGDYKPNVQKNKK